MKTSQDDPVLEFRCYMQTPHTDDEIRSFVEGLASRSGMEAGEILGEFLAGRDLIDPRLCDREYLVKFAEENGISGDPQMRAAILIARPLKEFRCLGEPIL